MSSQPDSDSTRTLFCEYGRYGEPLCLCNISMDREISAKRGKNYGRVFYTCNKNNQDKTNCRTYVWEDELILPTEDQRARFEPPPPPTFIRGRRTSTLPSPLVPSTSPLLPQLDQKEKVEAVDKIKTEDEQYNKELKEGKERERLLKERIKTLKKLGDDLDENIRLLTETLQIIKK